MLRRAFTLIELLVVVAILGVLAGLLTPVLSKARASSRRAARISNLRQIGVALHLYLEESNNRFPACCSLPSSPLGLSPVMQVLKPFGAPPDVFRCPADRSYFGTEGTSYGWNELVNGASAGKDTPFMEMPLLQDYAAFHGEGAKGILFLYRDGSVRGLD